MRPVIDDHPDIRAIDAELARVRQQQRLLYRAQSRDGEAVHRAEEEHRLAVREALERGEVPPPKPAVAPVPDYVSELHRISARMQELRAERREALERLADTLRAQVADEMREVVRRAGEVFAEHDEIRQEWAELAAAYTSLPGSPRTDRDPGSWAALAQEAGL